ncbi:hypothetical protein ACOTEN_03440, partial [Achromobacter xylosoxidans]
MRAIIAAVANRGGWTGPEGLRQDKGGCRSGLARPDRRAPGAGAAAVCRLTGLAASRASRRLPGWRARRRRNLRGGRGALAFFPRQ